MAQTHNENTSGSCTPTEENHFLYFSYLFENDDGNDAQGARKRVSNSCHATYYLVLFFILYPS